MKDKIRIAWHVTRLIFGVPFVILGNLVIGKTNIRVLDVMRENKNSKK